MNQASKRLSPASSMILNLIVFIPLFAGVETNRWIPLEPVGPRARDHVNWQKLVYDEVNDKIWLFAAGHGTTNWQSYANDVWLYDITTNSWTMVRDISTEREPSDQPSWRHAEQGRTFDTQIEKVIMFGQQSSAGPKNDTWTYDVATDTWTELFPQGDLPPIPNHFEYALEHDRNANVSVLFGGERTWSYPSDTWELDFAQNRWTRYQFDPPIAPQGRRGHAMAYCDALGGIIVWGGGQGWTDVQDFNDIWLYRSNTHSWQELGNTNPPPPRRQFSFDYDPLNNICLMFSGGVGSGSVSQLYSDTWVYYVSEGKWEQLDLDVSPPAEGRGDMMVFSRKHRAFFLMSGEDGNMWKFKVEGLITNVDQKVSVPETHRLKNNYPNPFNPSTRIAYKVSAQKGQRPQRVKLEVFNSKGEYVRTLVDGMQLQGEYSVKWNGKNESKQAMPSGVYIYRLSIDNLSVSKRMVLLK